MHFVGKVIDRVEEILRIVQIPLYIYIYIYMGHPEPKAKQQCQIETRPVVVHHSTATVNGATSYSNLRSSKNNGIFFCFEDSNDSWEKKKKMIKKTKTTTKNTTGRWWTILWRYVFNKALTVKRTWRKWVKVGGSQRHGHYGKMKTKSRGRMIQTPTTSPPHSHCIVASCGYKQENTDDQEDNNSSHSNMSIDETCRMDDLSGHEENIIGQGKFSTIYLDNQGRAVKTYKNGSENYATREKNILSHLSGSSIHPNIIQYYGWSNSTCSGRTELYLECCIGDLADQLEGMGSLPERVVKHLTAQLVSALRYLHAVGISHRDIKPENILLDIRGNAKIGDFGLSKRKEGVTPLSGLLTQCGSPPYAAPEVFLYPGTEYGSSCDWWSLGVVVFEMLTGNLPWLPPLSAKEIRELYVGPLDIVIPTYASSACKTFLTDVIHKDPSTRLGSIGTWEVKHHIYFKACPAIDWKGLKVGRILSPLVPLSNSCYFQ